MSKATRAAKGFTLIELLIVIGIIGFLAAAILVAVDPVRRIQEARNAKRWSETNAILNAILTKQVDDRALYNGVAPAVIQDQGAGTNVQVIVTDDTNIVCNDATFANVPGCDMPMDIAGADKHCVANLSTLAPTYIAELPIEPRGSGATSPCAGGATCTTRGDLVYGAKNTGYYIARTTDNRIEVGACSPDDPTASGVVIKVKR